MVGDSLSLGLNLLNLLHFGRVRHDRDSARSVELGQLLQRAAVQIHRPHGVAALICHEELALRRVKGEVGQ
jgi:hypothetical protein